MTHCCDEPGVFGKILHKEDAVMPYEMKKMGGRRVTKLTHSTVSELKGRGGVPSIKTTGTTPRASFMSLTGSSSTFAATVDCKAISLSMA